MTSLMRTTTSFHSLPRPCSAERPPPGARRGRRTLAVLGICLVVGTNVADAAPQVDPLARVGVAARSVTTGNGGGSTVIAPSAAFDWPVSPHEVVRRFDPPEVPWGSGHRGVDLRSVPGTAVKAPSDGVVAFSGTVAGRGVLTLRHPEGFDTTYEPVSGQLPEGTTVHRGDRIATLDPGHCDPACLHWGYKIGPKSYRDPLTLVRPERPVLLPLL